MVSKVRVEIDRNVNAAYVTVSAEPVFRSVQVTEDVLVDLDRFDVVVGVEVLSLAAELPVDRLMAEFHVHSEVIAALRRVRPSVGGFLSLTQSAEGSSSSAELQQLTSLGG
jgi:uncharacterized protein YuzE